MMHETVAPDRNHAIGTNAPDRSRDVVGAVRLDALDLVSRCGQPITHEGGVIHASTSGWIHQQMNGGSGGHGTHRPKLVP